MLVTCPECGAKISEDADPCPKCGLPFAGCKSEEAQREILKTEEESIKKRDKEIARWDLWIKRNFNNIIIKKDCLKYACGNDKFCFLGARRTEYGDSVIIRCLRCGEEEGLSINRTLGLELIELLKKPKYLRRGPPGRPGASPKTGSDKAREPRGRRP